ncbi:MAG: hypothetical protein ACJ79L_16355, partial [Anaeromyxobacteraceae bacterium]
MVRRSLSLIIAALFVTLPLAARAQTTPAPAAEQPAAGASATATVTPPAPAPEVKKSSGPTFTPYGFILVNAFMNSRALNAGDDPNFATTPGATNDRQILLSARYNRIGVRIGGMEALGAKVGATMEVDWGAGFPLEQGANLSQANQAPNFEFYRPYLRMRLGFATMTWGDENAKVTLLLGHDYGLVNPLFAVTLGYIGTPLFQGAGNLYTRSPQVKVTGDFGKDVGLTVAAAVLDPLDQNLQAPLTQQTNPTISSGDRSRWPQIEGRVAARGKSGTMGAEVGVSGAYHKERYLLGTLGASTSAASPAFAANGSWVDLDSAVGGVDAVFKFPFIEVRGEGFLGHNADMYFGHLGQGGVNVTTTAGPATTGTSTLTLTNVRNKRTKGFWVQGIVSPIPMVQLTGGYGVEVPFAEDVVN